MTESNERMIDRWFPVAAVDEACGTPAGSGRAEKAIFTWFASRPIAQARAAVLTAMLENETSLHQVINSAITEGDHATLEALAVKVGINNTTVVLDCFSGRGIIPLEAARFGIKATGTDLSPVATLAGRLLADWPLRDWSAEPQLPRWDDGAFSDGEDEDALFDAESAVGTEPRLVSDVRAVLAEVGRRTKEAVADLYPGTPDGAVPWGYQWATTIPCDGCKRRFPLVGLATLRHPNTRKGDPGQWFWIKADSATGRWWAVIEEGVPDRTPTFAASTGKRGKSARCPFCSQVHDLATVKAKGFAGEYKDALLFAADLVAVEIPGRGGRVTSAERKTFRPLRPDEEIPDVIDTRAPGARFGELSAIPDEVVAPGNASTVDATGYGYKTFGELMCRRQALHFVEIVRSIRSVHTTLLSHGLSLEYAAALAAYASSNLCRQLRRSTRGARVLAHGDATGSKSNTVQTSDVFANESGINFAFDFFEVGPDRGPGGWASVSSTGIRALASHMSRLPSTARPATFKQASATALPFRDASVDLVVTDPPYYEMINYADVSDIFYVWLRRCLFDIIPDLFGIPGDAGGLQDKSAEIVVKQGNAPGDHRTPQWYEDQLAVAFGEMRRVLKPGGHLVVVFGHSDPDAWRRLLGALQTAGFVVTSAWPSRTESGNTGVASIRVTVSIGCRVATPNRPPGIAAEVDREVASAVAERIAQWDADGLALEDQLMASYGPAMEVYGRYSSVLNPDGTDADLDRYLTIARKAVRDAMRLRVDELPLETFDAITRFSVFWLRAKGRIEVPKGEARFFAQADELRLDDLRGRILTESKAGFRLTLDAPSTITEKSSTFEIVRAMAHAWESGGTEAVADVMAQGGRDTDDRHLWAVVAELANTLPSSDATAKALAGIKRTASTISTLVGSLRESSEQASLFDEGN